MTLLLAALTLALAASSTGCGADRDPMHTTWRAGHLLSPPSVRYGLSGNPLMGAWRTSASPASTDDPADLHSDWTNLTFERDGTWKLIETKIYIGGAHPDCTEVSTWQGTFSGADPGGRGSLTLASATPGTVTRSGCENAAENGTTSSELSLDGTYRYVTILPYGHASYELSLVAPAGSWVTTKEWSFGRVDVEQSSAELTLDPTGTFELTEHLTYAIDERRLPGCDEQIVQEGTFVQSLPGRHLMVSFAATTPATIVRSGCADPASDGTTELAPEEALGPLTGEHAYDIVPDWEGSYLHLTFLSEQILVDYQVALDTALYDGPEVEEEEL